MSERGRGFEAGKFLRRSRERGGVLLERYLSSLEFPLKNFAEVTGDWEAGQLLMFVGCSWQQNEEQAFAFSTKRVPRALRILNGRNERADYTNLGFVSMARSANAFLKRYEDGDGPALKVIEKLRKKFDKRVKKFGIKLEA